MSSSLGKFSPATHFLNLGSSVLGSSGLFLAEAKRVHASMNFLRPKIAWADLISLISQLPDIGSDFTQARSHEAAL